ncbi:protein disulfide oxidoreductase [Candidatus Thiodiazotropha sp. CDECU1]|uniref:protein disulfide oxidoreductase n=1 Tax=Candidatus Thiodiazotropha sp. CDECU1 TaxID=3065865 RepID=UPI00292CC096|nr:protein disulfide oxidoreductase [Candidatus Thiodiazotropha sp. CDECU1]
MSTDEQRGSRFKRRLLSWLMHIGTIVMAVYLIHLWQTRDLVEGVAPALSGETLHGERFDLGRQTQGPLLVHFWATWCPVCKLESGGIASLSRDYPVVTVAMQSGSQRDVREFLDQQKLQLPVINDSDGSLAAAWGVTGVPTSYIVDGEGRIRFTSVGFTLPLTLRMRLWLTEIW